MWFAFSVCVFLNKIHMNHHPHEITKYLNGFCCWWSKLSLSYHILFHVDFDSRISLSFLLFSNLINQVSMNISLLIASISYVLHHPLVIRNGFIFLEFLVLVYISGIFSSWRNIWLVNNLILFLLLDDDIRPV